VAAGKAYNLDAAGQAQDVVARDIPTLADNAGSAVKSWTFTPGELVSKPVASSLHNSIFFNPGTVQSQDLTLGPLQPTRPPNPPG